MNFGPKELDTLAKLTNLSVSTCVDLLDNGWTYVEKIDCVPHWVSPLGRVVKF